MTTYSDRMRSLRWTKIKNECFFVLILRWTTDYEICAAMCTTPQQAIRCIIKAPKGKTDICYGWYISGCIAKWTNSWKQQLRSERLKSIFLIPSIFIDAWSWIVNVAIFLFRCGESRSMRIITKGKIINIGKMVRNINVLWLLLNAHSWITPSTKREREKKIICNIHDISNLVCLSFSPCNNAQHTHNALSPGWSKCIRVTVIDTEKIWKSHP